MPGVVPAHRDRESRPAGPSRPRSRVIRTLAAVTALAVGTGTGLFGIVTVTADAPPAEARPATGGSGRFGDAIDWVEWGAGGQDLPNAGFVGTSTRDVGGEPLEVRCTTANISGTTAGTLLEAYRPGTFTGDSLDNLYNIGGINAANQLVNGLSNNVNAGRVTFDISCTATLAGMAVPLAGLVIADAEQSSANQGEYIEATPATPATWRIIDRFRSPTCTTSTVATRDAANTLRLTGPRGYCTAGPAEVAFLEGATAGRVTLQGGGKSAVALGVVLAADHGDAPTSYGDAAHLASFGFSGGEVPQDTPTLISEPAFVLGSAAAPPSRLGQLLDPEEPANSSPDATGDDSGGSGAFGPDDDEDALADPSVTGFLGEPYVADVTCAPANLAVAGWLDWNRDGDFDDAGERSATATCAGGTAQVTWSAIPDSVAGQVVGTATMMRLRSALDATQIADPVGFATSGEAEDHRVTLDIATSLELVKDVATRVDADDDFTVAITGSGATVASASTGATDTATTQARVVEAGVVYTVGETVADGDLGSYLAPTIACTLDGAPLSVSGNGPTWTLPALDPGAQARCVITNTAQNPSLQLTKIADPVVDVDGNGVDVGDTIAYRFTVENTGNVELSGLTIDDTLVDAVCTPDTVAVNDSVTCGPVDYVLTAADVAAGEVVNTASANGTGPDGRTAEDDDSTTSPFPVTADDTAATGAGAPVTIDVAVNDTGGTTVDPDTLIFPTGGQPAGATVSPDGTTLTVPGEGVYTITGGQVVFDPAPTFSGTTTPVTYQIADAAGATSQSTLTVDVSAAPVAADDTGSGPFGADVTVDVLANDDSADGVDLDPTSVVFTAAGQPAGAVVSADGLTLTVPGEGTYRIDPVTGAVTFDPVDGFATTATPVTYAVRDENGGTDTATVTITVRPAPAAERDPVSTPLDTPVDIDVLANDTADAADPLDPTTVVFPTTGQPAGATVGNGGKTLDVPNEGTYEIDPDTGVVTFTPVAGFTGAATEVTYEVADQNGATTEAQIAVTVGEPPAPVDDRAETPFGVTTAPIDVLDNDVFATDDPVDATSVVFPAINQPPGAVVSPDGRTLTIPGTGVWTINPTTGAIVFDPADTFSGETPEVTYRVTTDGGTTATAQLVVDVGDPVVADDETATTPAGAPVGIDVLDGDTSDTDSPIDATSVVFPNTGQPADSVISNGGRTLTVPGQGVYTLDATTGEMTFAPAPTFTGAATPVTYRVADSNGLTDDATVTVTVGPLPTAADDTAVTSRDVDVTVDVLANDTGASGVDLDPTSVVFPADGQPDGSTVSPDGRTLTVPGEGVYTADPVTGAVTFDPAPGHTGRASEVTYLVADVNGALASAKLTVAVGASPVAGDDTARTPFGEPTDPIDVLGNDTADGALDPSSVVFPTTGQPTGSTVSADGKSLTVAGEGEYVIGADGSVVFTPVDGFGGRSASPVSYRVSDSTGGTATATLTVTVGAAPVANPDSARGEPGQPTAPIDLLGNDTVDAATAKDPTSVVLLGEDLPAGSVLSPDGKSLTVPGEGSYVVDATTGTVVFTPEPGFSGTATPVGYEFSDQDGATAASTLSVVIGAAPVALPDTARAPFETATVIRPLANDSADPSRTLDVTSVVFPTTGQPAGASVANGGKTLTVDGEGEYTVNPDGSITFTPADGFTGPATAVSYRVSDSSGVTATSTITPTVGQPVDAVDDTTGTAYDTPVTLDVVGNDSAGSGSVLDPTSVVFPTAGQPAGATVSDGGKTLTVPGEGVYTIDLTTGAISYDPDPAVSGRTTSPITYQVADGDGVSDRAQVRIDVGAGPDAAAIADRVQAEAGEPVTIDVLANDRPTPGESWVLDSLVFPTDGQPAGARVSADGRTLTVPGEGVYTINADGTITFTPEDGFSGETSPITYQVSDTAGEVLTATLAITMAAGEPSPDPDPSDRPNPDPSDPPSSGPGSPDGPGRGDDYWLPNTGGPQGALAALGLVLIAGGAAVLTVRRRRRG